MAESHTLLNENFEEAFFVVLDIDDGALSEFEPELTRVFFLQFIILPYPHIVRNEIRQGIRHFRKKVFYPIVEVSVEKRIHI